MSHNAKPEIFTVIISFYVLLHLYHFIVFLGLGPLKSQIPVDAIDYFKTTSLDFHTVAQLMVYEQ